MRKIIFLMIIIFTSGKCYTQEGIVYVREQKGIYKRIVYNGGIGAMDTFIIELRKNKTFTFLKKGVEASGLRMMGNWEKKGATIVLTNRYPAEKYLAVKVLPCKDSCNNSLLVLTINNGKATNSFFLNANNNAYVSGDIILFKELDTSGKVQICSMVSNLCSDWFIIPYKDCYRFMIDIDIDPIGYDSRFRKMYFKKQKNKLKLINSELSNPIPD